MNIMKTIKIEEKGNDVLEGLAKRSRMSKKQMVNMILENLTQSDVEMFRRRDQGVIEEPKSEVIWNGGENEDDEDYEIEFEEGGDDYDFEAEQEVEEFSPAEKKKQQLKLDAIKMGFVSEEEIDLFVKRNSSQ